MHQLTCLACGTMTRVAWPAGVLRGMMGSWAQALTALLRGTYRLSKRTTQRVLVLEDLYGLTRGLYRRSEVCHLLD